MLKSSIGFRQNDRSEERDRRRLSLSFHSCFGSVLDDECRVVYVFIMLPPGLEICFAFFSIFSLRPRKVGSQRNLCCDGEVIE
jgi:hypothetical protein